MSIYKFIYMVIAGVFLFRINPACARTDLEKFNYRLKETKLVYQQPAGYSSIDYTENLRLICCP
jgi:hypothetical protein